MTGIPSAFGRQLLPPDFDQVSGRPRPRDAPHPGPGRGRHEAAPERADELHARRQRPDGLGPGPRNLFVLSGFSYGIVQSGGAGFNAAAWIVDGEPVDNLWELDVRRFGPDASVLDYVVPRARETYEREYAIPFPFEELRPHGR